MAVASCIFCKIIAKEAPANILYHDSDITIFSDIHPAAKHHYLVVPNQHITDVSKLSKADIPLLKNLISHGNRILKEQETNLDDARYGFHWPPFRSVPHLHLHAISPASEMGFLSRIIFRPNSYWFVSPEYVLERLSKL